MNRSYNEKKHRKTIKKTVDIESEFVGLPVGPVKKKDKEPDLTDEINAFLDSEITLDSIMNILIRLKGLYAKKEIGKSKIKVYGLKNDKRINSYEFILYIDCANKYREAYFISSISMHSLKYLSDKCLDTSPLKQILRNVIWKWLNEHPDLFTHVD